jgi:predicted alpha-1,2-mannosidase
MNRFLFIVFSTVCLAAQAQYKHVWTAETLDFSEYVKSSPDFIDPSMLEPEGSSFTNFVDPHVGTSGHGHTFPGATTPFGMVQISPDNGVFGWDWCSGYHYTWPDIVYFSHKHLSGTGASDLGDIAMMPFTGKYHFRHSYSHENEYARPGYYAVKLDNGILCEFTASPRGAIHRYTFPEGVEKKLKIDLSHVVSGNKDIETQFFWTDNKTFGGYKHSNGWASNQHAYFAVVSSEPFKRSKKGSQEKAEICFKGKSNVVELRVALSTVNYVNALANLEAELANASFEEVFAAADQAWEDNISRISIEANDATKRTFYSAMYHAMIAPNLLSDVNGQFSNPDGSVINAEDYDRYSTLSLWDTYRAAHSLFIFLVPDLVDDFVNSMLAHYDYRGFLPIWELEANETFCMIGNHSIPVIAEAWEKGIRGFDKDRALEATLVTATQNSRGLNHYIELGYVPHDKEGESVSKTLEYAYNDWAVARFAEAIGEGDIALEYDERAGYYKNLFDPSTGLMRPKNSRGKWLEKFDQFAHDVNGTRHYTEGNAWQYSWSVQHDPEGFVNLFGSAAAFEEQLDKLFDLEVEVDEKHKLVDVTGLIGQYAHGNEPSHHVAYLYNYSENPHKTQQLVRRICSDFYTDKPDGLIGNEDCGQMSAWYIFSSLGFYPLDPVGGYYEIGSPTVTTAEMALPNGNAFSIATVNQSDENIYVEKVELNGEPLDGLRISHEQIMDGGELIFHMTSTP